MKSTDSTPMASRVVVPRLDMAHAACLLEGLPGEHFPLHWVRADDWRGAPVQDHAAPAGGSSSVLLPAPARVRRAEACMQHVALLKRT